MLTNDLSPATRKAPAPPSFAQWRRPCSQMPKPCHLEVAHPRRFLQRNQTARALGSPENGTGGGADNGTSTVSKADSDVLFVAKLAMVSFALGAGIKYGSLLLDAPFEANPLLALIIVGAPPISFAAYLLLGQRRE